MISECKFDPKRDLQPVVPDMAVDLRAAIETGVVLDTGVAEEYNDIDSPSTIAGRVRDAFDAFEHQRAIYAAAKAAAAAAPAASAPSEPSAASE